MWDIGDAAYDNQRVAATLIDLLMSLEANSNGFVSASCLESRYKLKANNYTGEGYLHEVASQIHHGDIERTSRRILDDFRKGILGPIPLELPPN